MTQRQRSTRRTILHIKNMVCSRCIKVVGDELAHLGIDIRNITLGEAIVNGQLSESQRGEIVAAMEKNGFELIEDRRVKTIEKIKHAILKFVQTDRTKNPITAPASQFLVREVGQEYHALSSLFSSMEGMTIEHYLILQKIERVKELIKYGELTLSEISYRIGYSSLQHLSNQFKSVTGMTPTNFKKMVGETRKSLDKVR
ncbi:MAG: helix-turn-helix domain-containing protein [Bacteroidota bacterium]